MTRRNLDGLIVWSAFIINALVILWFWWHGSSQEMLASGHGLLIGFGRLMGYVSAYAAIWEFVLMARLRVVERGLGREYYMLLHRWNGYVVIVGLVLHAIFLTVGYALVDRIGLVSEFVNFNLTFQDVLNATVASVLFVAVAGMSIMIVRRHFKYESWYLVHLSVYLALLLSFGHETKVGVDFIRQPAFVVYWYAINILLLALVVSFRMVRPWYSSWRRDFRVERVVHETADIVSIYLRGNNLKTFKHEGGQFAIWRFLTPELWWQAHPFSISSPVGTDQVRLTVKNVGDYTSQIMKLQPGARVIVDGPYGTFTSSQLGARRKVALLAGGIGLTPIVSMLPDLIKTGTDIVMVYAARTEADLALRSELEELAARHKFRLDFVLSNDLRYAGFKGYLDAALLMRLLPDAAEREIFLCGPLPMMKLVQSELRAQGVASGQIHTEEFAF